MSPSSRTCSAVVILLWLGTLMSGEAQTPPPADTATPVLEPSPDRVPAGLDAADARAMETEPSDIRHSDSADRREAFTVEAEVLPDSLASDTSVTQAIDSAATTPEPGIESPTPEEGESRAQRRPARRARPGGDHLGCAVAVSPDLDGDGTPELLVGAYGNDSTGDNAGAIFVISGASGDTLRVLTGEHPGDQFGSAVVSAGDVNGDGYADIVVGAPAYDGEAATDIDAGKVYVYSGKDAELLIAFEGTISGGRLGATLASIGRVDADDFPDLAVSQYASGDTLEQNLSIVYVFSPASGDTLHVLKSGRVGDRFGHALAPAGDLDSDGRVDVAVGAYRDSEAGLSFGALYVFSGRSGDVLARINGTDLLGQFGFAVAGGLDMDGDGRPDLLVGARFSDAAGGRSGRVRVHSAVDGGTLLDVPGQFAGEHFGYSVAAAPGTAAAKTAVIVVGAPNARDGELSTGAVYLLDGSSGSEQFRWVGQAAHDGFGSAVTAAGDVDGDGFLDVLVGAPGADGGGVDAGSAYLYSGATGERLWMMSGESTLEPTDTAGAETAVPEFTTLGEVETGIEFDFPVYDTTEVDVTPIIRRSSAAEYPPSALASGLSGWVFVRVLVLPDGTPGKIEISDDSGLGADFRDAAESAVATWSFLAATRQGESVACWMIIPIGFAPPGPQDSAAVSIGDSLSLSTADSTAPSMSDSVLSPVTDSLTGTESGAMQPQEGEPGAWPVTYIREDLDRMPLITARVDPEYPASALESGDTVTVFLRLLVGVGGGVDSVEVVWARGGSGEFTDAAIEAARRWRFDPGLIGSRAVATWVEYPIEFRPPE